MAGMESTKSSVGTSGLGRHLTILISARVLDVRLPWRNSKLLPRRKMPSLLPAQAARIASTAAAQFDDAISIINERISMGAHPFSAAVSIYAGGGSEQTNQWREGH